MTHDEIGELLGAYALDALSTEERNEVDTHVRTCTTCTEEVVQLQSVSDRLALLVVERDPPPALRTRLINLVEHDRRQWLQQQASAVAGNGQATKRGAWWTRVPKFAFGAGAAVVVALVLLIVVLANRNTVTVHTYRGGAVAQVVKGFNIGSATGTIDVRSDHTTGVSFSGLPVLPHNLAYELWLIPAKGAPVPVDGFVASPNHTFSMHYHKDAGGFAAAAVTIERAPGRWPAPAGPGVLVVPLKA